MDVTFGIQIGSDWPQMEKNLGVFKISFSTFWLAEPKCTETDLKKYQIYPIWGQSTPIFGHICHSCIRFAVDHTVHSVSSSFNLFWSLVVLQKSTRAENYSLSLDDGETGSRINIDLSSFPYVVMDTLCVHCLFIYEWIVSVYFVVCVSTNGYCV